MFLLDVNVLIALVDRRHVHHQQTYEWFLRNHKSGWATCPLTENGCIRIFGHKKYPTGPQNTGKARALLNELKLVPGYQFWEDEISICDLNLIPKLPTSQSLTDVYLLALAVSRQSTFVSLDQRIEPSIVQGGNEAFELIPAKLP